MFIIFHGDNVLASRKALETAKKIAREKEILVLDGKKLNLTGLKQALEAKSLFGQEKLVIVENLITDSRQQITDNRIFDYLKTLPPSVDLILWERKEIGKVILSQFKNARIQFFKTPAIIFKFLESIRPGNTKIMLNLLNTCSKSEPIELIFYMMVRQFRLLLLVKDLGKKGVLRLASWQYSRLTNQVECFTMGELKKIYKKLLEIDWQQKTGQVPLGFKKTLEFFLINL